MRTIPYNWVVVYSELYRCTQVHYPGCQSAENLFKKVAGQMVHPINICIRKQIYQSSVSMRIGFLHHTEYTCLPPSILFPNLKWTFLLSNGTWNRAGTWQQWLVETCLQETADIRKRKKKLAIASEIFLGELLTYSTFTYSISSSIHIRCK